MTAVTSWRDVDVVVDLHARLGEGPVWDHRKGALAWVDILAGNVHLTDPDGGTTTSVAIGTDVGAIGLSGDSGYLLAVRHGFATFDGDRVEFEPDVITAEGQRMNDGAIDPSGRFVAGSITDDRSPAGALYVREPDGRVRTVLEDVTVSNGIVWSADGHSMYYIDSALQAVDVMDYDLGSGTVSNRRRLVSIPEDEGTPDGMTIDADGCLWVALWGGAAVRRYSPAGELIGVVEMPVSRPTACAFGGPRFDRLFITSAVAGASTDDPPRPQDGALFVVSPGAVGFPAPIAETSR